MEKFEVNDLFNPQIINMSSRKQPMTSETEEPEAPKTNKEKMKAFLLLRRTRIATGVIIGLFGVFLLLSCISFFYTGAADQSEVVNTAFVDQEASTIENQGAIFGAYLAHIFVERGVGLATFIISIGGIPDWWKIWRSWAPIYDTSSASERRNLWPDDADIGAEIRAAALPLFTA